MKRLLYLLLPLVLALSCNPRGVKSESFGSLSTGEEVTLYTLTNSSGAFMQVIDYGCRVVRIKVPDRNGRLVDVVQGYGDLDSFEHMQRFIGCVIGRYANRIKGARFSVDGTEYNLAANEFRGGVPTICHGGKNGFDRRMWEGEILEEPDRVGVRFHYLSPDGEEGFPGNLDCFVTYWWTEDNVWKIEYSATTDAPTLCNISNHTYFNLKGSGSRYALDEILQVEADLYEENDYQFVSRAWRPVEDSPFDFREPHRMDYRMDDPVNTHLRDMRGMSVCWPLRSRDGSFQKACTLYAPETGINLDVWSTEPSLVTFTARNFTNPKDIGKDGLLERLSCVLLEMTHMPDTPNHPDWPTTLLRPGEKYYTTTEYRFSVR